MLTASRRIACRAALLARGAATSRVLEVSTNEQYTAALKEAKGLAVTDFHAKWCGPCRFIAPAYEQLAALHTDFLKLDIDAPALTEVVTAAGVSAVPTFAFHVGGKPSGEPIRGADLEALKSRIAAGK